MSWCDELPVQLPSSTEEDRAVAAVLLGVAREAASAVAALAPSVVEVVGAGVVARLVRLLVGADGADGDTDRLAGRPHAVVDTTGDPDAIASATRRLEDLGLLVLAGERPGSVLELNLYSDVHARGLTLVGVPAPSATGLVVGGQTDDDLVLRANAWLAHVAVDEPLPRDAAWFRVTG